MQDGPNPKILFQDNKIIVVVKPPGILSQSDISGRPDLLSQIKAYIKIKYNKPGNVFVGLVHRLDKDVGGIMVFARTSRSAKYLSEQIKNHEFEKEYLAIVSDWKLPPAGELTDYIIKDEKTNTSRVVSNNTAGAKLCKLEYSLVKKLENNNSLIKIKLITGRSHQIRVQFSSRGMPLSGDAKYGSKIDQKYISLWAYRLRFKNQNTKVFVEYIDIPEFA